MEQTTYNVQAVYRKWKTANHNYKPSKSSRSMSSYLSSYLPLGEKGMGESLGRGGGSEVDAVHCCVGCGCLGCWLFVVLPIVIIESDTVVRQGRAVLFPFTVTSAKRNRPAWPSPRWTFFSIIDIEGMKDHRSALRLHAKYTRSPAIRYLFRVLPHIPIPGRKVLLTWTIRSC